MPEISSPNRPFTSGESNEKNAILEASVPLYSLVQSQSQQIKVHDQKEQNIKGMDFHGALTMIDMKWGKKNSSLRQAKQKKQEVASLNLSSKARREYSWNNSFPSEYQSVLKKKDYKETLEWQKQKNRCRKENNRMMKTLRAIRVGGLNTPKENELSSEADDTFDSISSAFKFHHHEGSDPKDEMEVMKNILIREGYLSQLKGTASRLLHESSDFLNMEDGNHILGLLLQTRAATIAVCESIRRWGKAYDSIRSFTWDGLSYELKMIHDLDFLAEVHILTDALGIPAVYMQKNPFMMPTPITKREEISNEAIPEFTDQLSDQERIKVAEHFLIYMMKNAHNMKQLPESGMSTSPLKPFMEYKKLMQNLIDNSDNVLTWKKKAERQLKQLAMPMESSSNIHLMDSSKFMKRKGVLPSLPLSPAKTLNDLVRGVEHSHSLSVTRKGEVYKAKMSRHLLEDKYGHVQSRVTAEPKLTPRLNAKGEIVRRTRHDDSPSKKRRKKKTKEKKTSRSSTEMRKIGCGEISPADIEKLAEMDYPSQVLVLTFATALILLSPGELVPKDLSWKSIRRILSDGDEFLNQLQQFDYTCVPKFKLEALRPFLQNSNFRPEKLQAVSLPAAAICSWVLEAVRTHYQMKQENVDTRIEITNVESQIITRSDGVRHLDALATLEADDKEDYNEKKTQYDSDDSTDALLKCIDGKEGDKSIKSQEENGTKELFVHELSDFNPTSLFSTPNDLGTQKMEPKCTSIDASFENTSVKSKTDINDRQKLLSSCERSKASKRSTKQNQSNSKSIPSQKNRNVDKFVIKKKEVKPQLTTEVVQQEEQLLQKEDSALDVKSPRDIPKMIHGLLSKSDGIRHLNLPHDEDEAEIKTETKTIGEDSKLKIDIHKTSKMLDTKTNQKYNLDGVQFASDSHEQEIKVVIDITDKDNPLFKTESCRLVHKSDENKFSGVISEQANGNEFNRVIEDNATQNEEDGEKSEKVFIKESVDSKIYNNEIGIINIDRCRPDSTATDYYADSDFEAEEEENTYLEDTKDSDRNIKQHIQADTLHHSSYKEQTGSLDRMDYLIQKKLNQPNLERKENTEKVEKQKLCELDGMNTPLSSLKQQLAENAAFNPGVSESVAYQEKEEEQSMDTTEEDMKRFYDKHQGIQCDPKSVDNLEDPPQLSPSTECEASSTSADSTISSHRQSLVAVEEIAKSFGSSQTDSSNQQMGEHSLGNNYQALKEGKTLEGQPAVDNEKDEKVENYLESVIADKNQTISGSQIKQPEEYVDFDSPVFYCDDMVSTTDPYKDLDEKTFVESGILDNNRAIQTSMTTFESDSNEEKNDEFSIGNLANIGKRDIQENHVKKILDESGKIIPLISANEEVDPKPKTDRENDRLVADYTSGAVDDFTSKEKPESKPKDEEYVNNMESRQEDSGSHKDDEYGYDDNDFEEQIGGSQLTSCSITKTNINNLPVDSTSCKNDEECLEYENDDFEDFED